MGDQQPRRKMIIEDFQKILNEKFPNNKVKILSFVGASKPIKYQCLTCNRIYQKTRANHLYENKTLCQKCFSTRKSNTLIKVRKILEKISDIECLNLENGNTAHPLIFKCHKCGEIFKRLPDNFLKSQNCGVCGKGASVIRKDQFQRRIKENFPQEEYEVIKYTIFTEKCEIFHNCGFILKVYPGNFLRGLGCPRCSKIFSKGELAISNWFFINKVEYEYQVKIPEFLGGKSFDFLVEHKNRKILIEFHGVQHFSPQPFFGGEEKFRKQVQNDREKALFAEKHSYELLVIRYDEYENISSILSNFFGFNDYLERE